MCNSASNERLLHIMFCIADHFEPRWENASIEKETERTDTWIKKYTAVAQRHRDSYGNIAKHSFFYPTDEYTPKVFSKIADFCRSGFGEIELHLHHDNDTQNSLHKKLGQGKKLLSDLGMLSKDRETGEIKYGFIHGNWSLGNSRKDGRWCGVNNELTVLKESGCYADFTLPSAPSETQTQKINSIYYAKDTGAPKPHNKGVDVKVMGLLRRPDVAQGLLAMTEKDLMIIQGPLALNWKKRKFGIFPKIENAEITLKNPPISDRVDLWIRQRISVKGRPEWIFVKVHTHGAQDQNLTDEYFNNLDIMFTYLEKKYNDGKKYQLHYVTAREIYNIIKAAEAGEKGDPSQFRDYLLESRISKS